MECTKLEQPCTSHSIPGKISAAGSRSASLILQALATRLNLTTDTYDVVLCPTHHHLLTKAEFACALTVETEISCASGEFMQLIKKTLTRILTSESEGKQMGLKERLLGAIGTIRMALTPFWRIGPPADSEYAVEPVGVEMRIPSPAVDVRYSPFTNIYKVILSCALREINTSLMQILVTDGYSLLRVFILVVSNRISRDLSNGISILPW